MTFRLMMVSLAAGEAADCFESGLAAGASAFESLEKAGADSMSAAPIASDIVGSRIGLMSIAY